MCSAVLVAKHHVLRLWHLPFAQVKKDAIAISLIKGMRMRPEGPQLISAMVQRLLRIDCSVLMGANIAKDIGERVSQDSTCSLTAVTEPTVLSGLECNLWSSS